MLNNATQFFITFINFLRAEESSDIYFIQRSNRFNFRSYELISMSDKRRCEGKLPSALR